jgi:predicted 3-demethylubiquinone-9 3-methyltransferase (glyoxalase superfamily)
MQKITPFLWFDNEAEEAAKFYVSIFRDSKILKITHYGDAGPRPKGTVMTVLFRLKGQEFIALNGGPEFKFTEAISFSVNCRTQAEVDMYWKKLSKGGQEGPCGWLKEAAVRGREKFLRMSFMASVHSSRGMTLTVAERARAPIIGLRYGLA